MPLGLMLGPGDREPILHCCRGLRSIQTLYSLQIGFQAPSLINAMNTRTDLVLDVLTQVNLLHCLTI